jgi:phosphoheptose isomerase
VIWRLTFVLVIAAGIFTGTANAQPTFAGKFTLPYEVHWGRAILPAGNYLIRMDSTTAVATVTSTNGNMTVFTQSRTVADSREPECMLTISTNGNERKVRTLNLPEARKVVIFAPYTRNEREALVKGGNISTLSIVTAEK